MITKLFTFSLMYTHLKTMKTKTFSRRLQQLEQQLVNHTHRDEILKLATEQIEDDKSIIVKPEVFAA